MTNRYFIVHKPCDMLSQFISEKDGDLLGDIDFDFPPGTHAVGRLDKKSEGLLLLTTNKRVTNLLFQGDTLHKRTYLVKVKNIVRNEKLQQLKTGVSIRIKGGEDYITTACEASIVASPENIFPSIIPLPDHPPHTWLLITLTEGKYHQVRKMVKAIHHRCQRLIRVSIEDLMLDDLTPGSVREIDENFFFHSLKIDNWQPAEVCL